MFYSESITFGYNIRIGLATYFLFFSSSFCVFDPEQGLIQITRGGEGVRERESWDCAVLTYQLIRKQKNGL